MIKINDKLVLKEAFGDGTLKCNEVEIKNADNVNITWCYDEDSELFLLWCLVRHIHDKVSNSKISLTMPYIPHARQDRRVSNRLFTLKYFAEIINAMNFDKVYVLDPHSDVAMALLNNVEELPLPFQIAPDGTTYMFPDAGAAKKYSSRYLLSPQDNPFIIGNKHRNTEGRITEYELLNFTVGTEKVTIRDDICSYGGTFVAAAKELRKRGVKDITLVVSHCENNILKGEVFDYIDRVFTTDSICTITHPKLTVVPAYRKFIGETKC